MKPKIIYILQTAICFLILILIAAINVWAFPVKNFLLIAMTILLLAIVFYFMKNERLTYIRKTVGLSVCTMVVSFFMLNGNFYPQLLKYQGGNALAKTIRGNVDPANIYFWKDAYSSSFNFYTASMRKEFQDSIFAKGKKPIWLLFDKRDEDQIKQAGYKIGLIYPVPDFEISKLNLKFINPATRRNELTEVIIGEIRGKN